MYIKIYFKQSFGNYAYKIIHTFSSIKFGFILKRSYILIQDLMMKQMVFSYNI